MAYQTGSLSSINDLITKMAIFGAAHGFTVNRDYTSSDSYHVVEFTKGGKFWLVAGQISGTPQNIYMKLNPTGAIGSNLAWSAIVATNSSVVSTNIGAGPYVAHHFFISGNTFGAVIEYAAGKFMHAVIGYVTKCGTWTGGEFIGVNRWTSSVPMQSDPDSSYHSAIFDGSSSANSGGIGSGSVIRWDRDGVTPNYLLFRNLGTRALNSAMSLGRLSGNGLASAANRSPNTVNGRSILFPMQVIAPDDSNTYFQFLGVIDGMFYVNIRNLSPGDTVDTDYKVFPLICKNGSVENSANYGFAYKMV